MACTGRKVCTTCKLLLRRQEDKRVDGSSEALHRQMRLVRHRVEQVRVQGTHVPVAKKWRTHSSEEYFFSSFTFIEYSRREKSGMREGEGEGRRAKGG